MRVRFYVRPSPGPPAVSHTMVSAFFNTVLCTRVFIVPRRIVSFSRRNIVISYSRVLAVIEVIILADLKADGARRGERKRRDPRSAPPYPVARKRHIAKLTGELSSAASRPNGQFLTYLCAVLTSPIAKQKFRDFDKLLPPRLLRYSRRRVNRNAEFIDTVEKVIKGANINCNLNSPVRF